MYLSLNLIWPEPYLSTNLIWPEPYLTWTLSGPDPYLSLYLSVAVAFWGCNLIHPVHNLAWNRIDPVHNLVWKLSGLWLFQLRKFLALKIFFGFIIIFFFLNFFIRVWPWVTSSLSGGKLQKVATIKVLELFFAVAASNIKKNC